MSETNLYDGKRRRTTTSKDIARLRTLARAGYSPTEASRAMGRYQHFAQVWARSQSIAFRPGSRLERALYRAAAAAAASRLRALMAQVRPERCEST